MALRMAGRAFIIKAGGDVTAAARATGHPWRVGVQHPHDRRAILGVFNVAKAVATSGTYERGHHIRSPAPSALLSVSVVGPDLGAADGLATAAYAAGQSPPRWWPHADPAYGLLTMSVDQRLRWLPPATDDAITWEFPTGTSVERTTLEPSPDVE